MYNVYAADIYQWFSGACFVAAESAEEASRIIAECIR